MESTNTQRPRIGKWRLLRRLLFAAAVLGFASLYCVYKVNNRLTDFDIPNAVVPSPNGYDDFALAGRLAADIPDLRPFVLTSPTRRVYRLDQFRRYAHRIGPVQAAIRRGLSCGCLVPPRRRYGDLSRVTVAQLHSAARALAGAAVYRAAVGDWAGATDLRLDGMEMAVKSTHGANIADTLIAFTCEQMAVCDFEAALPHLTRDQLAYVARRLQRIAQDRGRFADNVLEEANFSIAAKIATLNDPDSRGSFTGICREFAGGRRRLTAHVVMRAFSFMMSNKHDYITANNARYMALETIVRRPYRRPSHVLITPPSKARLTAFVNFANNRFLTMETIEKLIRTEVALERYHADDGRYPSTLAALSPGYITAPPVDPFAGNSAPLVYNMRDIDHYSLYSKGPDMRDDGGRPARDPGAMSGDIVAFRLWPNNKFVLAKD